MIFPVLNLKTFLREDQYQDAINVLTRAKTLVRDNYLCLVLKHDLQKAYTDKERRVSEVIRDAIDMALDDNNEINGCYKYELGVEDWAVEMGFVIEDPDQYRVEWIDHMIKELTE